eukprot:11224728-Lingulodinium_polyedra.AAC.1
MEAAARRAGGHFIWHTQLLRPGRLPSMQGPGVEPAAVHALQCVGPSSVADRLWAAARGEDEDAPDVWGPDRWRNAVA